jgi:hypothetical protein
MAKKDKFSDMQMPPLWTGVAGQGNQKIYSLGGRWHPVGSKTQSGYQIIGDDGKGNLALSWNGLPVMVPMQGSTIKPYTPPMAKAPAWMGDGVMTTKEEEMAKMYNPYGDPTLSIDGMDNNALHETYNVIDREGIDNFIGKMRTENPNVNFGTLLDYQKATPEMRKKGFNVWNNKTGDFSDFFQDQ